MGSLSLRMSQVTGLSGEAIFRLGADDDVSSALAQAFRNATIAGVPPASSAARSRNCRRLEPEWLAAGIRTSGLNGCSVDGLLHTLRVTAHRCGDLRVSGLVVEHTLT